MDTLHVEPELIAYLDGELDAAERARVEAHLARCPACAAQLEELRALQRDAGATLDAALTPVRLSREADDRIRRQLRARLERPQLWWAFWQRRGLVAQAALAVLLVFFSANAYRTFTLPAPAPPQETLVLGQDRLSPGSQAALRVIVRSAETALPMIGAEVAVSLVKAPGVARLVYQGRTDGNGAAAVAFTVPEDLEGKADLVVETRTPAGEGRIVRPIDIRRSYKIYLASDKPVYRPGQTLHMRALVLDAISYKPAAGQELTLMALNSQGTMIARRQVILSEYGIAAADVVLSAGAAEGAYTLRAVLGDTVSERAVTVGAYTLPPFRVTLNADRTYYAPGERVTGAGEATYFFGKPVVGGQVVLRGYADPTAQAPAFEVLGKTDEIGSFTFAFDLPRDFGVGAVDAPRLFSVEAEVTDAAGQRAGIRATVPVAAQPLVVNAVPEGGKLKPGVENLVYVLVTYPDGTPARAALDLRIGGQAFSWRTDEAGIGGFFFTPTGDASTLEVTARDEEGLEGRAVIPLAVDRAPERLLLRTPQAAFNVGDTLTAEALVAGEIDTVYLDVIRARQTVAALSAPVVDGRAAFALDLDGAFVGGLELRAYALRADGSVVQDARTVVVEPSQSLKVEMRPLDHDGSYAPGETATLEVRAGLADGPDIVAPVQAALGIAAVDESVYALDTLPPGFARAYFYFDKQILEQRDALNVRELLLPDYAARDLALRAVWADAPAPAFSLRASATTARVDEAARARRALANQLGALLTVLPLLVSGVVARGLAPLGLLGRALRRLGWGLLALILLSPLLIAGGVLGVLLPLLGAAAFGVALAVVAVLLVVLLIHGWLRRDVRVQLVGGLVAAYLVLGGILVMLAARSGGPAGPVLALIVAAFLLLVGALSLLGQGLVLEGRRAAGWITTLLALLLVLLVVTLPAVPEAASDFTRALGNPGLYAGPLGWLAGCAAAPREPGTPAAEATQEPAAPIEAPTEAPAAATPTPPPTSPPVPVEPYPLRQIFPETLYWAPEALTDESGAYVFDVTMPDTLTSWRFTALGSTREGAVGSTAINLTTFKSFFIDFDVPDHIEVGAPVTITVTLYNYLDRAESVRWDVADDAAWYTLLTPPEPVRMDAHSVTTATLVIRPEQRGAFSLRIAASTGRLSGDAMERQVTVP